jgi:hypothetical protein
VLSGRVIDSSSTGVEGVTVSVYDKDKAEFAQDSIVTDATGSWSYNSATIGNYYQIRYYKVGYTFSDNNIECVMNSEGTVISDVTATALDISDLVCIEGDYTYSVSSEKVTITKYNGSSRAILLPTEYNGYPIVSIGNSAFENNRTLEVVCISDNITSIGSWAFENCVALKTVYFPNGVTSINGGAFSGCTSLTNPSLPNGLKQIGGSAFANCIGLTEIEIPNSVTTIGGNAFSECLNLSSISLPTNWNSASGGIFYNCNKLTSITLPEGMTRLPNSAFENANKLKTVVLPSTLQTIGSWAFENCVVLDTVNFPDGLKTIGGGAFSGCAKLAEVSLPNGLTEIGGNAFANCTSITELTIPNSVTTIGGNAFSECANLASIDLPTSWNSASGGIFYNCNKLTNIAVPEGVVALPNSAFENANKLKTVVLPSTLQTIGSWAFENCVVLDTVNFPDGLKTLNSGAFSGCTKLADVSLPNGLTEIGGSAFANCTSITELTIPNSVTTIGGNAFAECTNLASIDLPTSWNSANGGIFYNCNKLTNIAVPEGIVTLPNSAFENANKLKTVVLPSTLQTIGSWAFENCVLLDTVNFPDGLKTLNSGAFSGCTSLTSANLPDGVTTIGGSAFYGCTKLVSFHYPKSWNSASGGIFYDCAKLTSITVPEGVADLPNSAFENANCLRSVVLPTTLQTVGNYSFENCARLRCAVLQENVSSVGNSAFSGCSDLRYVMIIGTTTGLSGDYVFDNCPKVFLYCKWNSDAIMYAIQHDIEFQPLPSDPSDYTGYVVDMDQSNYFTSSPVALIQSNIPVTLHYYIPENVYSNITNGRMEIMLTQSLELIEGSVSSMGKPLSGYDYSDNLLSIPVSAPEGTFQFYVTALQSGQIASFARFSYSLGGADKKDTIGTIYLDVPLLKLNVPSQTSNLSFNVTGVASASEAIILSIDGTQVGTTRAKKDGTFSATVTIPSTPTKETTYTVNAKLESNSAVSSSGSIVYRADAPTMTQFDMYYYGPDLKKLDLMNTEGTRLTNSIYPNHPFKFVVRFDNFERIGKVFIASTRNGITNKMQAYETENTGEFVAEGYFDGVDTSYIPRTINVYYTTILTSEKAAKELSFEELPEYWQNSTQTVLTDSDDEYVSEFSFEDGGSVTVESKTVTLDELRSELLGEPSSKSPMRLQSVQLMELDDDAIEAIIEGFQDFIKDFGKSTVKKYITNGVDAIVINDEEHSGFKYVLLDPLAGTIKSTAIKYGGAGALYGASQYFTASGTWADCLTVSKFFHGEYKTVVNFYKDSVSIDDARSDIQSSSTLSAEQKAYGLEKVDQLQWCYYALNAARFVQPFFSAGLKYSGHPVAAFIFDVASNIVFDIVGSYLDKSLDYYTAGGQGTYLRWLIDPSGYVYDADNSQVLEGVTVTAYWIPYDESDSDFWNKPPTSSQYGTIWEASEYSQQNPLLTDAEGNYAWDVPEGWWRVKYEKDGYETIWSDWMTVPPIQTDVNIGMTSTILESYSVKYVSATTTGTTVSLTNNTSSVSSVVFIVAAYNGDGKMIATNTMEKDMAVSESINLTVSYKATDNVSVVKAFVVQKGTMTPLREAGTKEMAA